MTQKQVNRIIKLLKSKEISFDKGLSNVEIIKVESDFNISFPEDLKMFLQTELPTSSGFVHWRYGINSEKGKKEIENRLNWPIEGILFDVQENSFWLEEWNDKPENPEERIKKALNELAKQPKLIPIYSHRYISEKPKGMNNPIFSVYQTDIIMYGTDLADYFSCEFNFRLPTSFDVITAPKRIEFWSDFSE